MANTNVTFIGTDKYYEVYGNAKPTSIANDVENLWNNQVDSNGSYTINIDVKSGLNISNTSTIGDALSDARGAMKTQTELNYYDKDAVIVIDARDYGSVAGRAYIGSAGSDYAVGYVSPADRQTAAHELGHVYGATHDRFVNFGLFSYTLMENGKKSCYGNNPDLVQEFRYSGCSRSAIRDSSVF